MSAERRKKLRARAQKRARQSSQRYAGLARIAELFGVEEQFNAFDDAAKEMFRVMASPSAEIVMAPSARDDERALMCADLMSQAMERTMEVYVDGGMGYIRIDDFFRYHFALAFVMTRIPFWAEEEPRSRVLNRAAPIAEEALDVMFGERGFWALEVIQEAIAQFATPIIANFKLDGRQLVVNRSLVSTGRQGDMPRDRLEIRATFARPVLIPHEGRTLKTYRVMKPDGPWKIAPVSWDGAKLGGRSTRESLPVFITTHALRRLEERLQVLPSKPVLHRLAGQALSRADLIPCRDGKFLASMGCGSKNQYRLGYFLAEVLPDLVLIKTFLFLTMNGTPEAELLRDTLGMSRADIEHYQLDKLHTLVSSDIADDPLLVRVFRQCGCGHLLSFLNPDRRDAWLQRFGDSLKTKFELREAPDGFAVGRKWIKSS
jgi:hypothetical protein